MRNLQSRLYLLLLLLFAPGARALAQASPSIEYTSLLKAFTVYPETRALGFNDIYGAFFPEAAIDRGQAGGAALKTFLVLRDASGKELLRNPRTVHPQHSVFTRIAGAGTAIQFTFEKAGAYSYSIELDGQDVAKVDFTVELRDSGDPFNPVRMAFLDGPWSNLAQLKLPNKGEADGNPSFQYWDRGGVYIQEKTTARVEIRHDGDVVFVSQKITLSPDVPSSRWQLRDMAINFLEADGGGRIKLRDLTKLDGDYDAIIFHNDKPWKLFRFQVAGNKLVPHPRQKLGYQPHADYLVARNPVGLETHAVDLIWMTAESSEALQAAANATAAKVSGPSTEMRAAWTVQPSSPAGRKATLKLTTAASRMDADIAVGDDVIAYATGSIKGISWLRVGEDVEHTLPGGQDFHSKHFFVCGKKIVMLRGAQVVVFDTETETLHEVPLTEVSVAKSFLDNYKGNQIAADGYLVATLNDPKKVDDRVIPKVIDVSGPTPRVIALKNTEVAVRELESVAVDAATGKVVMCSNRNQCIFVADVAPRAVFEKIDLSSIDGIARETAPMLAGGWFAYFDASGSRPKFRLIELASKRTQTLPSLGKSYRCYDLTADRLAFATTESYGSEYVVGIGAPGAAAKVPEGAGGGLAGTAAKLGLGSSIAITGGLTFIAGMGKGGVGSGEYLQVSDGASWHAILGPDGKPLPAVDVVASDRVVAFKTGKRNDTTVGYIALGANTKLSDLPIQ